MSPNETPNKLTLPEAMEAVTDANHRRATYLAEFFVNPTKLFGFLNDGIDELNDDMSKTKSYYTLINYLISYYHYLDNSADVLISEMIDEIEGIVINCDTNELNLDPNLIQAWLTNCISIMRAKILLHSASDGFDIKLIEAGIDESIADYRKEIVARKEPLTRLADSLSETMKQEIGMDIISIRRPVAQTVLSGIPALSGHTVDSLIARYKEQDVPGADRPDELEFFDTHITPDFVLNTILNYRNIPRETM